MLANDTYEIQSVEQKYLIETYIPLDSNNEYDKCHLKQFEKNSSNYSIVKCDSWVYSRQYYEETLVTKVLLISLINKNKINFQLN